MHSRFLFTGYNFIIESASFQKIRILGLVIIQVALGIVLKIDKPPIALAQTLFGKEWKETN
jgi:hypothetical protein